MATAKTTVKETYVNIPLKDILAVQEWNSRSGNWVEADGDDEGTNGGHSFKDLVASIESKGQDSPVTVRPKGKKYELITGFRRFVALSTIAAKTKNNAMTIKAIVKNLSDVEARSENLRENCARDDLKGPDLAYGLFDLYSQRTKASGAEPTDSAIASEIGKNQSYVSKLLRIMKRVKPAITKQWREAPIQLSINEMDAIAKLDPPRQQEQYDTYLKGKGDGATTGRGKWLDAAKKKAATMGAFLGSLEKAELIDTASLSFDEHIGYIVKVKDDATAAQRKQIAHAAEKAYQEALHAKEKGSKDADSEDDDDDDDSDD